MNPTTLRQKILGAVGAAAIRSPPPNRLPLITPKREPIESILEGSFYEIDHSKLPTRTPAMLRSVRAVMVTAKCELNVTVRYPSTRSLAAYFDNVDHIAHRSELYPELDEKYIMGPKFVKVLRRQIPSREFEELRHLKSFWLRESSRKEELVTTDEQEDEHEVKHGGCFSNLQDSQIKGWGSKRLVAYLPGSGNLNDIGEVKSLTSVEGKESLKEEECHETNQDKEVIQYSRKRKRGRPPSSETKKKKHSPKQKPIEVKAESEEINNKDYVDRWPTKRYEAAAMELAEVLKKNGGYHDNPMSRMQLRIEARKRIGDTGLLDHLLKHLAGQVVPPDGKERICRRCDAEGMMEYWLESADLVNIRKEAGVNDPFWVPPPGWKLGDTIGTPNCTCRNEIKMLKKELNMMRSQMVELKTKDETQQPIAVITPDSSPSSGRVRGSNMSKKETYEALIKKKHLMEEQLLQISIALRELQEGKNSQSNQGQAAESLQLIPHQSLQAEEMSEDMEEAEEAAAGNSSESDGEEDERGSRAKRVILKLKPCRQLDDMNNNTSLSQVDYSVQDFMTLNSASGSPLSTTTS